MVHLFSDFFHEPGGGYASDLSISLSTKVACIVPLFHILGENHGSTMTTPPGRRCFSDRPHGTPELWNVLCESYRAEQTDDHVVLSSRLK